MNKKEIRRYLTHIEYMAIFTEKLRRPLTSAEVDILVLRYLERKSWEYIALRLHMSRATVCRMDAEIIDNLIKINGF